MAEAVCKNALSGPLHTARASSQHGGWVPRVSSPRERAGGSSTCLWPSLGSPTQSVLPCFLGSGRHKPPLPQRERGVGHSVKNRQEGLKLCMWPSLGGTVCHAASSLLRRCLVAQSCLTLDNLMDCGPPGSMTGFSRQEYWSGLPFTSPGDLPDPGIEPASPAQQANSLPLSHLTTPIVCQTLQ